ncbi:hypothetical protein B0I00_2531 [Novosphingobium kunmingense]|uniref:Uncharacterized protein n=1 Tax=Novosphingobium kunmingense TaxID=1211806 RepID=A0A2N0H7M2_9SPHN|nr:hypothetical protein B0I00_2531 [Novosphingobium kunmingense]
MKRWLTMALLLTALFGLIGQATAFAHAMPAAKFDRAVAAAPMDPDCAKMVGLTKPAPQPVKPCKGMTPDCAAKMGCAVPFALMPPVASGPVPDFRAALLGLVPATPLVGRDTGPEPEPPTHLG